MLIAEEYNPAACPVQAEPAGIGCIVLALPRDWPVSLQAKGALRAVAGVVLVEEV